MKYLIICLTFISGILFSQNLEDEYQIENENQDQDEFFEDDISPSNVPDMLNGNISSIESKVETKKFDNSNILNTSSPEELRKYRDSIVLTNANEPVPYGYVDSKDILWSKEVWEIVDLNEKINQPYYATSDGLSSGSKSLYQAIFDGIQSGQIKEVYSDDNFRNKITADAINNVLYVERPSEWFLDKLNSGEVITDQDSLEGIDRFTINTEEVEFIKIRGLWYIDRRLGEMKYRILGIAPMGPDPQLKGMNIVGYDGAMELIDMFWVFYPDARKVLVNYNVFNPRNTTSSVSFDDVLNARRFHSIIYKTDDLGGITLKDKFPGDAKAQMEESNRIKRMVLEQENNLWNY